MNTTARSPTASWNVLVGGAIATDIVALSVHVGMLQGLGIPFPDRSAVSPWATLINTALSVLAFIIFSDLARASFKPRRPWLYWLIMAAVFGMLKEAFRGNIMNAVVTTAWTFSFAQMLSPVLYSLALAGLVVISVPRLNSRWLKLVAALVITAAMTFVVKPLLAAGLSPLMASVASLNHADVYPFPYGAHVLFWAYVTYLEPVVACIVAAALVWPRLSSRPLIRIVEFVALIMLIKGAVLPTFVFSLFNAAGVAQGMLSESQFLLEALALGLMTAMSWQMAGFRDRIVSI